MALATQCPHCQTRFRVASDQLKLRGGIVRCGTCQRIFDGSAHLIDLDAPVSTVDTAPAPAALPSPASPAVSAPLPAAPAPAPVPTPTSMPTPAQDSQAPHGDVLADTVAALVDVDADADADVDDDKVYAELPPDPVEARQDQLHDQPQPQPQDPAAPHGDALAHLAAFEVDDEVVTGKATPPPGGTGRRPPFPPLFPAPDRVEPSLALPTAETPARAVGPAPDRDEDSASKPDTAIHAPLDTHTDTDTDYDPGPPTGLPLRASSGSEAEDAGPSTVTPAPASRSARAKAVEARARRTMLKPARIEAPKPRAPEMDEPEFVKRSRKQAQSGRARRILMGGGSAVLVLALAAQVVLDFRNVMAAAYPATAPALGGACALLGCRVELPTQVDNLAIENGELSTLGPATYSLNTLLRNQGSLVQAWPSIELELTDANDKAVLRRVFTPAEYLPQGVPAAAGFAGGAEQPVKLHFALADLKPSGYHIFIFYP